MALVSRHDAQSQVDRPSRGARALTSDFGRGFYAAAGLIVSPGLLLWTQIGPTGTWDPPLLWGVTGIAFLVTGLAAWLSPVSDRVVRLAWDASCWLVTLHVMTLAHVNEMHPFYAGASVMSLISTAMHYRSRKRFAAYTAFFLLVALASLAIAPSLLKAAYWLGLMPVLVVAWVAMNGYLNATRQLAHYQSDLERLVDERTSALQEHSAALAAANEQLSREIAERERAERSLRVWQRLQGMARLAGGVAHDFNNLLTTVTVYGELLRDRLPEDSSERHDAEEICRAAERATALTGQLLAFSRDASLESERVDLNDVLRDAHTIVASVSAEDIEVVMDLAPFSVDVRGNRSQFEQVVANLTANARDAMPDGGVLEIQTRVVFREELEPGELPDDWDSDPVAVLSVRDTGTGMDEETIQQIFDPFFTTKEVGKGTGLGLAAVYGIVQQSQGWIGVESRPGGGTCFTIYWPSDVSAAETGRSYDELARDEADSRAPKPQILVVDDEPSLRALVARILEEDGCEVTTVGDAESALEALRDERRTIDLLVADVVLPGHNGIDLWRKADRLRPGLRVLFISGHLHHPSLVSRDLPQGTPLLPKPFSSRVLVDEVRTALEGAPARPLYR